MDKRYKFLRAKTIIVLVMLCLLFTACGGQGQETDGGENSTTGSAQGGQPDQTNKPEYLGLSQQQFDQNVDLSIISVRLTAGADLTLYLDENGTILAAHCHNDEAITVCGAAPVLEAEFGSALFAILNEMTAKAYLEDGSRLDMNIVEEQGAGPQFPLYDVIDEMFQQVKQDSGADIGVSMNSTIGSVGAVIQGGGNAGGDGQQPDQGGQHPDDGQQPDDGEQRPDQGEQSPDDSRFLEEERDENGNLIRTLKEDSEGKRIERFYRTDGTCMKEIILHPDGLRQEQILDEHEQLIGLVEVQADGTEISVAFRADGSAETETLKTPDGSESVTTFRADGTSASVVQTHADGTKSETIMNEQGIRVSLTEIRADGSKINRTFTDDGKDLFQVHNFPDGSHRETNWEYDDAGVLISQKETWSDGRVMEERFNEKGVMIAQFERQADGYTMETTFTQDGKPLTQVSKHVDGSYNETTYYANGNRKMMVNTFADGRSETWHYTEDGTTGTKTETYHANGKVAKETFTVSPSIGLDYTYEEYVYDENGTMLTHTKIQNNGVIGVSTYHYDKSHTTVFTYPGGGGHTEYWYGNNLLGGIDSDGNAWGVTVPGADYSGLDYSGTIGKG